MLSINKVYCPHTAVDAAMGGNADWLADAVVYPSDRLKEPPHHDLKREVTESHSLHQVPSGKYVTRQE